MVYTPLGQTDEVNLSIAIVRSIFARPTKSGAQATDADIMKFIMLCRARRLDPFQGDAHLVGYDDSKLGPVFAMITAHQALAKRAEVHEQYDGMESGIILVDENDNVTERETDFHLPKEVVVGGWARVWRKDISRPTFRRLRLAAFSKDNSFWHRDMAGMIVKCAEADAYRSAFPSTCGGLYTGAEGGSQLTVDIASVGRTALPAAQTQATEPEKPVEEPKPSAPKQTPQEELAAVVHAGGFDWDTFRDYAAATEQIKDADSLPSWSDIKTADATRLLRMRAKMLADMNKAKDNLL